MGILVKTGSNIVQDPQSLCAKSDDRDTSHFTKIICFNLKLFGLSKLSK